MKQLTVIGFVVAMVFQLSGCSSSTSESSSGDENKSQPAASAAAGIKDVITTTDEMGTQNSDTFAPDTAAIHARGTVENVPNGDKIRGVWICTKSEAAPPDFKIDEATVTVGPMMNTVTFTISKPNKGFPVGEYRIEIYWNDKLVQTKKFEVK